MVGVKPMRWTTIERETEGGPVWACLCVDASEGCKEVDQHQAHMHTDDDGDLVIVLFVLVVLVDGWLVVARQPRIPTDATCESTRNFLVLDWLLDDSAQMSDGMRTTTDDRRTDQNILLASFRSIEKKRTIDGIFFCSIK